MSEQQPPKLWAVIDSTGGLMYAAMWQEACHEHINDAINEHDIDGAKDWVVREYVPAAELSRLQAENEALRDSVAAKADRIDRLGEMVERLQAGGQGVAYFQVYRCKVKNRRQIMKEIPREQQGWWADVAAGQVLNLRQATQADIDRCNLSAPRSKDPQDYMCETFERGALVSKAALEYMNPEQLVFARVGAHPPAAPACRSQSAASDPQAGLISTGETQQPAAPAPYLDQLIGDLLMPLPAFTARELHSLHRRAAEILQLSRSVNANKHPPAPALVPLTRIDELAKVYAKSYASPHHFTIDCEGIRKIINGLTVGGDGGKA